jgi:hypothetical protein
MPQEHARRENRWRWRSRSNSPLFLSRHLHASSQPTVARASTHASPPSRSAACPGRWRYGEVSGNPRWKGMAWGMVPCLGSAMCACTWHFFYNSPDLKVGCP